MDIITDFQEENENEFKDKIRKMTIFQQKRMFKIQENGSEFKTWDADISITDTELSKLCTIHSATTKPSKVTPGTGSDKNNSKETTAASTETSGKTNSSDKRP